MTGHREQTIWALVAEAADTLPEPFSRSALISWISERRPDVEISSISTHIQFATGNAAPSLSNPFRGRAPLLHRVDRGLYRRYRRSTGQPEPTSSLENPVVTKFRAPPTPRSSETSRVLLVGCSRTKGSGASRAGDLFRGEGFQRARTYALRSGAPWFILSAKFGLLAPDDVVGPYDVYLKDQPASYRATWGDWVAAQLAVRVPLAGVTVEVHASEAYCLPLIEPLCRLGATVETPLAGLRQGERLAWYGGLPESAPGPAPDVQCLLEGAHAVSPAEFLAAGRAAAMTPGLYSWWVDQPGAHLLSAGLGHRVSAGLIYAGRAGGVRPNGQPSANTLWGRVAEMHLGGNRSFSTFRLTLAAALSSAGEPVMDESSLTEWMHRHLRVKVLPMAAEDISAGEAALLRLADPPLNLRDMAATPLRQTLSRQRSALSAASKGTA